MSSSRIVGKSGVDSKDLVISQLKREIMELKISDKDYNNISAQLTNLERRYTQLKQEKSENEMEFGRKTDHQMKTLASLKSEIDSLFVQCDEKNNEYRNGLEDYEHLEGLLISKEDILENQRVESQDYENRRRKIEEEVSTFRRQHDKLSVEKNEQENHIQRVSAQLEDYIDQAKNIENEILDNQEQNKGKTDHIEDTKQVVEEFRKENEHCEFIYREKENDHENTIRIINDLETEVSNVERDRDTFKSEVNKINGLYQKDLEETRQLEAKLHELSTGLKQKEKNMEQRKKQVTELTDKNNALANQNVLAAGDNALIKDQIRHTININKDILEEIERFIEIEGRGRCVLDRRHRYTELYDKCSKSIK